MTGSTTATAVAVLLYAASSLAQTTTAAGACATVLTPSYSRPVVAGGWIAQLIVKDLSRPRGILFDQNGALLVVEQGSGIRRLTFNDNGGTCLSVKDNNVLIGDAELNHGIDLSADGKTLYASTRDKVYSWAYNAQAATTNARTTLVGNMSSSGHTTRTIMLSRKSPNTLLVSRGSDGNIDPLARDITSGHSHIRAFDISALPGGAAHDYNSGGRLIGWGLRNSVGIAEDPATGAVYSVENSADQIRRNGQDIHQDNPGEELNFHGYLNGSTDHQGGNYGYPDCFALWDTNVPDRGALAVGSQFAVSQTATVNDQQCAEKYVAPRLTFQAHMAPLDMVFTADGKEAFVTFHGSWNRNDPVGYKLSSIAFTNGQPTAPPDSITATRDIMSNPDLKDCPGRCFRPVGLAWDSQGRLFMSSDSTGEIYVLRRAEMTALDGTGPSSTAGTGAGGTLVTPAASNTPNAAASMRSGPEQGIVMVLAALALSLVGGAMVFAA